ncbi:MAG: CspA family cold shock protein [Methanobacteriota archaeon]|jgi:CspA family cold shock protein|uniref:Cold shock domain-containing protein n=1 Tax=Halorutilus salinus TaxID=2487751 RepID=A0A9Q4C5W1_9EURY|nr:cold shock domain-containing protein [Halorutilus salinus]MCX2818836.1 cold shock domain-containing protein [Halorutilus salinus]
MPEGTVKFYHEDKKYGFIEMQDDDDDVFFHISQVRGAVIEEGEKVKFRVEEGEDGPRAADVARLS